MKTASIIEKTNCDKVNHPSHYTSHPSGIECIDITKYYNFCIGNVIKYVWRAGLKTEDGYSKLDKEIEDLEKAMFYLDKQIEMLKQQKETNKNEK